MMFKLALLLLVAAIWTPAKSCETRDSVAQETARPMAKFAVNLFKKISEDHQDNFVFSPLAVSMGMAILERGSSGLTQRQLKAFLIDINQTEEASKMYQALQQKMMISVPGATVLSANSLCIDKTVTTINDFCDDVINCFHGSIQRFDFGADPEGSRTKINFWASELTQGRTTELAAAASIGPGTWAVLANAFFLKAAFHKQFNTADTVSRRFKSNGDGDQTGKFMTDTRMLHYGTNERLDMVRIPLFGDLNMDIYLPKDPFGLPHVEEWMTQSGLQEFDEGVAMRKILLKLPKFSAQTNLELSTQLGQLGMDKVFQEDSDLSRMFSIDRAVISGMPHEACIKIDELGVSTDYDSQEDLSDSSFDTKPPLEFYADHPFIFTISQNATKTIVMMGKVNSVDTE